MEGQSDFSHTYQMLKENWRSWKEKLKQIFKWTFWWKISINILGFYVKEAELFSLTMDTSTWFFFQKCNTFHRKQTLGTTGERSKLWTTKGSLTQKHGNLIEDDFLFLPAQISIVQRPIFQKKRWSIKKKGSMDC